MLQDDRPPSAIAKRSAHPDPCRLTKKEHNLYIVCMDFDRIIALEDGPAKTAALVAWIQGLFADDETAPVLVGGAAVEL